MRDRCPLGVYRAAYRCQQRSSGRTDIGPEQYRYLGNDLETAHKVIETDLIINNLRDKIVKYLSSIFPVETVTEHQSVTISGLMHVIIFSYISRLLFLFFHFFCFFRFFCFFIPSAHCKRSALCHECFSPSSFIALKFMSLSTA